MTPWINQPIPFNIGQNVVTETVVPISYIDVAWDASGFVQTYVSSGSSTYRSTGETEQWNSYNRGQACDPSGTLNALKTTFTGLDSPDAYCVIGYATDSSPMEPADYSYGISWQPNNCRLYYSGGSEVISGSDDPTSSTEIRLEIQSSTQKVYVDDTLQLTRTDTISGTYYICACCFSKGSSYPVQGEVGNL